MTPIAVIGAGMAGLACARPLADAGRPVLVFDKGRGVGGRMATRRVETPAGVVQFDHGAQDFTVRHPAFRRALETVAPAFAPWSHGSDEPRFVGAPAMNSLPKALAAGLDVRTQTRITRTERANGAWFLHTDTQQRFGPFAALVIAAPAEQAAPLAAPHHPAFAAEALAAHTAPCWAGLFAYAGVAAPPFAGLRLADHPVLAWVACDSVKPGRPTGLTAFVAHARPDWSAAHLEEPPEAVAPLLREALEALISPDSAPLVQQAHRWRYALVETPAPTPFAWDGGLRLGLCGDWRIGPRVEAAWLSGHALAGAILA